MSQRKTSAFYKVLKERKRTNITAFVPAMKYFLLL